MKVVRLEFTLFHALRYIKAQGFRSVRVSREKIHTFSKNGGKHPIRKNITFKPPSFSLSFL